MIINIRIINFLFGLILVFMFLSCQNNKPPTPSTTNLPNIIIVITDDQGYGDLSCHGNPHIKTPFLDQLYKESTRLTDFHVNPTCAPTRAALLTGHDANRTGVWHTIGGRSLLLEKEVTLPEVLRDNGYSTGIFGKWHLGDNFPFRPQDRGFQEVLVHGGGGVGQQPDFWNNDYFDDTYYHNGQPKSFKGYCTDVWFQEAIKFMEQNRQKGQPFFSYIATNAPHGPFYVSEKYQAPFLEIPQVPNASFAGMISNVDENMGKLLHYLEEKEIVENTILVFMTDNGTAAGARFDKNTGLVTKGFNAGMRNGKGSMYDGGHRVPFFIRWAKGGIPKDENINELTAHVDVFPTLIDLLGIDPPNNLKFDGKSLMPLLKKEKENWPNRILITDSQRMETPKKWRQSSVMMGSWRLINGVQLYNIQEDPGQQNDVSQNHPEVFDQLKTAYEKWWSGLTHAISEVPRIVLCPPKQPITQLHVHDLHMAEGYNSVPWNNLLIRKGHKTFGWYAVKVDKPGTFVFNLSYWPPDIKTSIRDSVPAIPQLRGTTVPETPKGIGLPIVKAGVSVDGNHLSHIVQNEDQISFTIPLSKGEYDLKAWFSERDNKYFAANYVKVRRLND